MARSASHHPTELELAILKIIWRQGSASVRQMRDALADSRDLAYTSVLTVMNIMARKGYLRREMQSDGSYVYHACISEESTSQGMLRDLVDRVFDGSAMAAALNLLETSDIDADELKHLRDLINRKTKGQP